MKYFDERISAKIYWSLNKNIPVFIENYKDEPTILVKATPPRDLRPALSFERRLLKNILDKYFEENYREIISPYSGIILLNKISYPDAADEIIVDGQIVGHMFFDVVGFKWRFKPMYVGVNRILKYEKGYYAFVKLDKIVRKYVVHRGDIKKCNLPEERGEFIAVSTWNGLYHGVGRLIRNNRIFILKSWRRVRDYELNIPNSMYEAVKENREWLVSREEEAIKFLGKVVRERKISKDRIFISFSGGKDSLATLIVSLKSFDSIPILFNDTGLELPDVKKYVEKIAEKYGLTLIKAEADKAFFKYVHLYGPPARDYRWCCKVIKLAPIVKAIRRYFSTNMVLSIVGQRKYESLSRAFSPRVWTNRWMPGVIVAAPILNWSCLETWLYVLSKKVYVNSLYFKGFDRLGCWLCPACEIAEFIRVKELYREYWNLWERFLEEWRKKLDLPSEYIKYHLWRWKKIMGDQKQIINEKVIRKVEEKTPKIVVEVRKYRDKIIYNFYPKFLPHRNDYESFRNLLNIFGNIEKNHRKITIFRGGKKYSIINNFIYVEHRDKNYIRDLKELIKIYLRANYCNECELCLSLCPENAIFIKDNKIVVNMNKCKKCLECNNICPIANYIAIEFSINEDERH